MEARQPIRRSCTRLRQQRPQNIVASLGRTSVSQPSVYTSVQPEVAVHSWRWLSLLPILGIARSPAVAPNAPESDFKKLPPEELLDVKVASVSPKTESLCK